MNKPHKWHKVHGKRFKDKGTWFKVQGSRSKDKEKKEEGKKVRKSEDHPGEIRFTRHLREFHRVKKVRKSEIMDYGSRESNMFY